MKTIVLLVWLFGGVALAEDLEWQPLGPPGGSLEHLAVGRGDPTLLFGGSNRTLVRSQDRGRSWQALEAPVAPNSIDRLWIDTRAAPVFYARLVNSRGLFAVLRLSEDGRGWTQTGCALWSYDLLFPSAEPGVVYCNYNGLALRSTDDGLTFESAIELPASAWSGAPPDVRFSLISFEYSTDGGQSWSELAPPSGRVLSAAISVDGQTIIVGTEDGVFRSEDLSSSWQPIAGALEGVSITTVAASPSNPALFLAATAGGDLATTRNRGVDWVLVAPTGLGRSVASALRIGSASVGTLAIRGYGDVVRSTSDESTWHEVDSVPGQAREIIQDPRGELILVRYWDEVISWSEDGGVSWSSSSTPAPCGDLAIANRAGARHILCASFDALLVSSDVDGPWQVLARPGEREGGGSVGFNRLLWQPEPERLLVIRSGPYYRDLMVSEDWGSNFRNATTLSGDVFVVSTLSGLRSDPRDQEAVYVYGPASPQAGPNSAGGRYVARLHQGASVLEHESRESGYAATSLAVEEFDGDLYLGTGSGELMRSADQGRTWEPLNRVWGAASIFEVRYRAADHSLTVSTASGIYSAGLSAATCSRPGRACLAGGTTVDLSWRTDGDWNVGSEIPLTSDSTAFWFFEPDNVEVVVKVLDGCSVNGHLWVFAAGLTDVETRLEVRQLGLDVSATYDSEPGVAFPAVRDTWALPCQ